MPATNSPKKIDDQILIRGADILASDTDFQLIGRAAELKRFSGILMRDKANSVILLGAGGVGCTALCKGLQASKDNPDAPFDIITKKLFWLNTDTLFKSGDPGVINKEFTKIIDQMRRLDGAVIIFEDAKNFIDAARNNGCSHLINSLLAEIRNNKFQAILEAREADLGMVLSAHPDMRQFFTLFDLGEPVPEELPKMIDAMTEGLVKAHGIKISNEAKKIAIELTNKFRVESDLGLSRAQPERTMTLLDRALSSYRQVAHAAHPDIPEIEWKLAKVKAALAGGVIVKELEGYSTDELQSFEATYTSQLEEKDAEWKAQRTQMRQLYKDQRDGEETIRGIEKEIEDIKEQEEEDRKAGPKEGDAPVVSSDFAKALQGGIESQEVQERRALIKKYTTIVAENKTKYEALTAGINDKLVLTPDHIYAEFSAISGIPASKLNEDERKKILGLNDSLGRRVFNQDHAIEQLSDAIMVARGGLQDLDKPQASFMFMGPSGSGKTELTRALADEMGLDLLRLDMSEYMEKHAVARLIGAPPGYDGFEAGGILTNAMRKNPNRVILFDEVEKAHRDVFDILLQVLDAARLTDNRGLVADFSQSIIILTTNIGSKHFLDPNIGPEEARGHAMADLEEHFRPEFLNRFEGRQNIVGFNKLNLETIQKIARREFGKLNGMLAASGSDITVDITDDCLMPLCADNYDPETGARGITGYIKSKVKPSVARTKLVSPDAAGLMQVEYDSTTKLLVVQPPKLIIPPTAALAGASPAPA